MRRLRRRNHKRLATYAWFNWYAWMLDDAVIRVAVAQEKFHRQFMEVVRGK